MGCRSGQELFEGFPTQFGGVRLRTSGSGRMSAKVTYWTPKSNNWLPETPSPGGIAAPKQNGVLTEVIMVGFYGQLTLGLGNQQ